MRLLLIDLCNIVMHVLLVIQTEGCRCDASLVSDACGLILGNGTTFYCCLLDFMVSSVCVSMCPSVFICVHFM